MRYLRVDWLRAKLGDPVTLYSELDDTGYELRKVEVFADGQLGFASEGESTLGTELGEKPLPPLETIAADPEFRPVGISREEFESVWAKRQHSVAKTG